MRTPARAAASVLIAAALAGCASDTAPVDGGGQCDVCASAESMRRQLVEMVLQAEEEGRDAIDDPTYLRAKSEYAEACEPCTGKPLNQ